MNFRYYLCLLSFLCFFGTLFSQEKDSLQQLSFEELKSSYSKFQFSNPKTAKVYADAILEKAISEKNIKEENNAYLLQSRSEGYFGNMSNALALTEKSISYAKRLDDTDFYVTAIRRKGMVYYNFGKYDDAVTYYLKIDSIARITKNIDYQIDSNQSIGAVKTVLGDHRSAAKLFLENEAILTPLQKDPNYTTQYLNTIIGLCSAYTYFDIPKSEKYLSKIKEVSSETEDRDALSYYYTLKGIIFYLKHEYDVALETFEKADSLVTALGRKRSLFPVYRFQGKAYYDIGKFEKTIEVYEKIKILRDTLGFDHFKYQEVIATLASSYDTLNNLEKAIENFTLMQELVKANDTIKQAINYEIKNKYDDKIFEDKISQLTLRSKKKDKQNTSLIYVSIGLVLILILLFIVFQRNKISNRKKFESLLTKLEQSEKEKTIKPTVTRIKEKKVPDEKIAQILHDLKKFEDTNAFLHKNTSLTTVSKKLNTNTSYLSKTINAHKGTTFINYITKLRIDYALQNLKNDTILRSYSIKAIAEELGFKSEGAFSRAFKKETGIYPSYFIKNLTSDS